ncbi:MFS transporter [Myxacorys almedinensis A]|uniref:MFS transporter n=1 Tax=Myxacorys almedinensis A TaxID=2690445 RepID=A0A8J8CIJ8_9CYAN|nr:MFS transporter [Myxacorys almedinensis A]
MVSTVSFLPRLQRQVWLLAFGRLLSQIGTGFTLFYAPIFFVNQVGLSATAVGLGIGSASISGIIGRVLGGSFADSKFWGRRRTLLLSAAISAIADVFLASAYNFPTFVVGNLFMGLGIGIYWPATEAVVADLTTPDQRNEAYSITRLCDSLGLGIGVVLGGILISTTGLYRLLFVVDGISFVVFFGMIYVAIAETNRSFNQHSQLSGWKTALSDRRLVIYAIANTMFTTYIVQIDSTLPLYFSNFVRVDGSDRGFEPATISILFTGYLTLAVLIQLPIARALNRWRRSQVLMVSALFWSLGFLLIWITGTSPQNTLTWAAIALSVLSFAIVTYTPSAASLVVELAPESLRGVYLGINSQCWALGYLIGPPLGGWALDQPRPVANRYWLFLILSVAIALSILWTLDKMMVRSRENSSTNE